LNEKLVKENEKLKAQVIDLNSTLTKFTKGNENLDQLLHNQRCILRKVVWDINQWKLKNLNFFVKASTSLSLCNSYEKNGFHEKTLHA
jgi:hypothetical protein